MTDLHERLITSGLWSGTRSDPTESVDAALGVLAALNANWLRSDLRLECNLGNPGVPSYRAILPGYCEATAETMARAICEVCLAAKDWQPKGIPDYLCRK